jgi:tetratricopeptide (TPR) repeat protein
VADFAVVRFRFWLLLALATLFSSPPARADDASRFKELVKQATDAFGRGDFERAIDLCNEAFAIKPNPRLLYNRARAEEALGNAQQAIADYELYLEREPQTEDRGIIEGRIKALRAQLAESERLAGERAQSAGKKTEARAHYRRYLELAPNARDKKEIEHRLWELDHPPPPKKSAAPAQSSGGAGPGPWITVAVGGAVLTGGTVFGLLSRQKYDDAKNASSGKRGADLRSDGDRFTTFANVGFVAGGVIALSGFTWLLLSPSSSKKTSAAVSW